MYRYAHIAALSAFVLLPAAFLAGCRSPAQLAADADQAAARRIAAAEEKVLGRAEADPFTVERPSDTLRRRLMAEQNLAGLAPTPAEPPTLPDPLVLSLEDALRIGARNSRDYQASKESVFAAALALDLAADAFLFSLAGAVNTLLAGESDGDANTRKLTGDAGVTLTRKLQAGAALSTRLALDLAKLLTADRDSSLGLSLDASVTLPLLRGAGRAVAAEPLTQAERNLLYAVRRFERYKQDFAVRLAADYLAVLQQLQSVRNAGSNLERVRDADNRARKMAEAGRLPGIQLDQARQDLLRAETRLNAVRQSYESRLDSFKLTLGLPADARIALLESELADLAATDPDAPETFTAPTEAEAVARALADRFEVHTAADTLEDARRSVALARDALRAGLTLKAAASTRDQSAELSMDGARDLSVDFRQNRWSVGLGYEAPWERTAARNHYRESLVALDRAQRNLEELEDRIKLDVRNALRSLAEAREAVRIQALAVTLARSRVASTEIYLQAGRAEVRDVLEAQDALVSAQDALAGALVNRRMAELQLQRDIGALHVDNQGLWRENEPR